MGGNSCQIIVANAGFKCLVEQTAVFQNFIPTGRLLTQVGTTAVLLAGWIDQNRAFWRAHQPGELSFIAFFPADKAGALGHMFGPSGFLLFAHLTSY